MNCSLRHLAGTVILVGACCSGICLAEEFRGTGEWLIVKTDGPQVLDKFRVEAELITGYGIKLSVVAVSGEDHRDERVYWDGKDCYYVMHSWNDWDGKSAGQKPREFAIVDKGGFPARARRVTQLIWLTLLNQGFPEQMTNSFRFSGIEKYVDPSNTTCFLTEVAQDGGRELEAIATGGLLVGGRSMPVRSAGDRFRVWKCSFQRQNTNAVQVIIRGLFSQLLPFSIPNDGGVDLREIYRAECVLESQPTLNSRDATLLPRLMVGTEVLDNRFSERFKESVLGQKPVLSYTSSNGTWLPASEAEVQTNLVVIQAALASKRRQEIVGPLVFGAVFLCALFPVIYFVVKRRRFSN